MDSIILQYTRTSSGGKLKTNSRMSIRDVIVMLQLRNHVSFQRIQNFLEVFLYVIPIKSETFSGKQEKESTYNSCEDGMEKSVRPDHRLSSLVKPHDANIGDPLDGLFYPNSHF